MITPIRIPANQIVFKKIIPASLKGAAASKISSPNLAIESGPLSNSSMDLSPKGVPVESSIPWNYILIGVTVLVVGGVIYYQIEKRRRELAKESY